MTTDSVVLLVLLTLNLAFVSYLIWARLGWQGTPAPKALWTVAELWIVFGMAAAIFAYLSALLSGGGPAQQGEGLSSLAGKPGAVGELAELARRFAALPLQERIAVAAAALVPLGLLAHCLYRLNGAMQIRKDEGNGE